MKLAQKPSCTFLSQAVFRDALGGSQPTKGPGPVAFPGHCKMAEEMLGKTLVWLEL